MNKELQQKLSEPIKQTVYLPTKDLTDFEQPLIDDLDEFIHKQKGYFFTPEKLNEYTQSVIKQALETAAEKANAYIDMNKDAYVEGNIWSEVDKKSITNTFEEIYKKFFVSL